MFTVEDIDDTLARLGKLGAEFVGEVVQYEDAYRLCYIRGLEGILMGLAQELGATSMNSRHERSRKASRLHMPAPLHAT